MRSQSTARKMPLDRRFEGTLLQFNLPARRPISHRLAVLGRDDLDPRASIEQSGYFRLADFAGTDHQHAPSVRASRTLGIGLASFSSSSLQPLWHAAVGQITSDWIQKLPARNSRNCDSECLAKKCLRFSPASRSAR